MATTSIEWTDRVWNPVTGCTKVSPGCKHCYAETIADRFWATQYPPVSTNLSRNWRNMKPASRPRRFTDVLAHEDRLLEPLSWRKPAKVFVNSMSDLFHEDVPYEFIMRVWGTMHDTPRHSYQILTKRAERMADIVPRLVDGGFGVLPNVWLGVSVEDQPRANERIPLLLQTPAAVRFLSCEPLLAHLNVAQFISDKYISVGGRQWIGAGGIHWVIVGGESGPDARPCDLAWVRSIVAQCNTACVACFVKQLGTRPIAGRMPHPDDMFIRLTSRKGGDPAEWPEDLRVREFPCVR